MKHYIQINNKEVQINEPLNFSNVDFSIVQDDELYFREFSFAGRSNNINFELRSTRHENIFREIVDLYEYSGSNATAFYILEIENDRYKMRIDFSTCETDLATYITFQVVVDNIMKKLKNSQSVEIDLLSEKDIEGNLKPIVPLKKAFISSLGNLQTSNFDTKGVEQSQNGGAGHNWWNLNNHYDRYEINNTLTWLETYRQNQNWFALIERDFATFNLKDNYKNIKIHIKIQGRIRNSGTTVESSELRYILGTDNGNADEWYNNAEKIIIYKHPNTNNSWIDFNIDRTFYYDTLPRGTVFSLVWHNRGGNTTVTNYVEYNNLVEITGESYSYGSVVDVTDFNGVGVNIASALKINKNLRFKDLSYGDNLVFNGNMLRGFLDKSFNITIRDFKAQIKELGLGMEEEDTVIRIKPFEDFYLDTLITTFNSNQKYEEFKVIEDDKYNVNTLEYRYKKYQAIKENEIEGSALTKNGESQWYIKNKYTDNALKIDLPFVRDKFLTEETRRKELAYKENTATSEDNTIYLFERNDAETMWVDEFSELQAVFQNGVQILNNDSSFSWHRIGVSVGARFQLYENNLVYVYNIQSMTNTSLTLVRADSSTKEFNETRFFEYSFLLSSEVVEYINMNTANDNYTIRKNLEKIRPLINCYNHYTRLPINNTLYKEDATPYETSDIPYSKSLFIPREYQVLVEDNVNKFNLIKNNPNGYIRIIDSLGRHTDLYIKELHATFLTCDRAQYRIIGLLKNN